MFNHDFFRGKKVFITGHTGFKGSWLAHILSRAGAEVTGYALPPEAPASLYALSGVGDRITSIFGDVRNFQVLDSAVEKAEPDVLFHLAAQALVRKGYEDPRTTYETNVMGTLNVLETVRRHRTIRSVVNVTTDKVYENMEWEWGYRETDNLDGWDPYSNSKSCSELITRCYRRALIDRDGSAISTARAGNVIGGGDFSKDRIIPDCIRGVTEGREIIVRNPRSVRPYQHVIEPIFAYMLIAVSQCDSRELAGEYNVGPDDEDCVETGELVRLFCEAWGPQAKWEHRASDGHHESTYLRLDCSRIKRKLGWAPRWDIRTAVEKTVEWTKSQLRGEDLSSVMDRQIDAYLGEAAR